MRLIFVVMALFSHTNGPVEDSDINLKLLGGICGRSRDATDHAKLEVGPCELAIIPGAFGPYWIVSRSSLDVQLFLACLALRTSPRCAHARAQNTIHARTHTHTSSPTTHRSQPDRWNASRRTVPSQMTTNGPSFLAANQNSETAQTGGATPAQA